MNNLKPYWTRHPFQRRVTAALLLLLSPIILLPFLVVVYWGEIMQAVADAFSGMWAIVTGPDEKL